MSKLDYENIVIENKPVVCECCKGKMLYVHSGMYRCNICGHEVLDNFGKVKRFLEENGPMPVLAISQATGVNMETIEYFLRKGRVEIPDGSRFYIKCEKCGCNIRYGRFCPDCIRELAGGIMNLFYEDIGEKPKSMGTVHGKMHFLNRR